MSFLTQTNKMIIENAVSPLLGWYDAQKRKLPWRDDPTPYHVWVSEIMLQQTRVEAVKHYYKRFLARYPDIFSLAETDPDELAKYWEGLGYYSRMRNLLRCAKTVVEQHDGVLPNDYYDLLKLPGIGSYTAGAISSIAYGMPYAAVDGNVLRVLSRLFSCGAPIDEQTSKNDCFALLNEVMPDDPGAFNQSLMELGATVCLPNGTPLCEKCPVRACCTAYQNGNPLAYPVKKPKKGRRVEQLTYLLVHTPQGFLLHKRADKGLLASLWEYPNLPGFLSESDVAAWLAKRGVKDAVITRLPDKKHIFTHIEWQICAYAINCDRLITYENELLVTKEEIKAHYALPSAFDQYDREAL